MPKVIAEFRYSRLLLYVKLEVLVAFMEHGLFGVRIVQSCSIYIRRDTITDSRKPLNISSLYYESFRPSNKRPNPIVYGHSVLQLIRYCLTHFNHWFCMHNALTKKEISVWAMWDSVSFVSLWFDLHESIYFTLKQEASPFFETSLSTHNRRRYKNPKDR